MYNFMNVYQPMHELTNIPIVSIILIIAHHVVL